MSDGITKIAIFKKKEIRKTIYNNEWWFVINDVIQALTDSKDPVQYFKRMKLRDPELKNLAEQGGVQFVPPLRLAVDTAVGKQKAYFWNTEGIFRLIQSVPSPKAEPLQTNDSQGFNELQEDVREGGAIAGNARKELEKKTQKKVSTKNNYLPGKTQDRLEDGSNK